MSVIKNILVIHDINKEENFDTLVNLSCDIRYGTSDEELGFVVIMYFTIPSRLIIQNLYPSNNWFLYTSEDIVDNSSTFEIDALLKIIFFIFEEPNEIKIALFPNGLDAVAKRINDCSLS